MECPIPRVSAHINIPRMIEKPGNRGPGEIVDSMRFVTDFRLLVYITSCIRPFWSRLGRVLITWMGNGHVIRNSDSKIMRTEGLLKRLLSYATLLFKWAIQLGTRCANFRLSLLISSTPYCFDTYCFFEYILQLNIWSRMSSWGLTVHTRPNGPWIFTRKN